MRIGVLSRKSTIKYTLSVYKSVFVHIKCVLLTILGVYLPTSMLETTEESLIALVLGFRKTRSALTPEELAAFDGRLMEASTRVRALILARLGQEPEDVDMMDALLDAGILYMLSRQDQSVVSKDVRDARKEHFEYLLSMAQSARKTRSAAWTEVRSSSLPSYI
jgi:hypothetical protein